MTVKLLQGSVKARVFPGCAALSSVSCCKPLLILRRHKQRGKMGSMLICSRMPKAIHNTAISEGCRPIGKMQLRHQHHDTECRFCKTHTKV